jgi:hypothetical protein
MFYWCLCHALFVSLSIICHLFLTLKNLVLSFSFPVTHFWAFQNSILMIRSVHHFLLINLLIKYLYLALQYLITHTSAFNISSWPVMFFLIHSILLFLFSFFIIFFFQIILIFLCLSSSLLYLTSSVSLFLFHRSFSPVNHHLISCVSHYSHSLFVFSRFSWNLSHVLTEFSVFTYP